MTDLEISKTLALAIGWDQAMMSSQGIVVQTHLEHDRVKNNGYWLYRWRVFDYRDWNVIGPIAKRYNCFPICYYAAKIKWRLAIGGENVAIYADTPQKAIALAVIRSVK